MSEQRDRAYARRFGGRDLVVAVAVDVGTSLERRDLRHVDDEVDVDAVGADPQTRVRVHGEVAERDAPTRARASAAPPRPRRPSTTITPAERSRAHRFTPSFRASACASSWYRAENHGLPASTVADLVTGTVGLACGVEHHGRVEVEQRVRRTEPERAVDVRKRAGDVARPVQRPRERVVDEHVVGTGVVRTPRQLDGMRRRRGVVGVVGLEDRHLEIGDLARRLLELTDRAHQVEGPGGGDPLPGLLLQVAEQCDGAGHR